MSSEPPDTEPAPEDTGDSAAIVDAVRAMVGLRPLPEAADLSLAQQLACAVIALGAVERQRKEPFLVTLPGTPLTTVMLGELLLDAGELAIGDEPSPEYDPLLPPARERFFDTVRDMAERLKAAAPQRPRLVTVDGRPLVR